MRRFVSQSRKAVRLLGIVFFSLSIISCQEKPEDTRPNFLFVLSDDQSWAHTSFAGYPLVSTPNFDRIAREGLYFANAFVTAPTCTASRSSILSGQPIWRLGSAANLHGEYSPQMISFQQILVEQGYFVGFTGKGWGPGLIPEERQSSVYPLGRNFSAIKREVPSWIGPVDYAANFAKFLDSREEGVPFSFWVGSVEPHRPYSPNRVNRFDEREKEQFIPEVLPNTPGVQNEFSAYLDEIEFFDRDLGSLIEILSARGLLENTVVIVTSDNGMPFSRGKPTNGRYGVQVPLSIRWGGVIQPGRVIEDFVSLADIAPTLLDLAGVVQPSQMTGRSLKYALISNEAGIIDTSRDASFSAFERHAGFIRGGAANLTYPRRAIHTKHYDYIRNYYPERWPAGDPPDFLEAYPHLLRAFGNTMEPYFTYATQKQPAEELYDISSDPNQINNLADIDAYASVKTMLADRLHKELVKTGDPLEISGQDPFQSYGYFGPEQPKADKK